ncbi:MAG: hypothetical protein H0V40_13365 [Actinobacteria bacterium]|nr:hypothetical protein [Actinomycetota bacterium]
MHGSRAATEPVRLPLIRRGVPLAVALALAAFAAGALHAAPSRDTLVRPGLGVGKVRLGMTVSEVRRAMGRHDIGVAKRLGFGSRRLELTWWSGLADHFIVQLVGPRGRERVVSIATSRTSERTATGIGPGVRVSRLLQVYPRARCQTLFPVGGGTVIGSEFVIDAGNGRETAFARGKWSGSTARPIRPENDFRNVAEVIVRTRAARPPADAQRC